MALCVRIRVASGIAYGRNALRVGFPGLARGEEIANDVVHTDWTREGIIVGDDLTRGQHEVVADRRVSVGEILSGQAILRCQAVQIRYGGTPNHFGIAVVSSTTKTTWPNWGNVPRGGGGEPGGLGPLEVERPQPAAATSAKANKIELATRIREMNRIQILWHPEACESVHD